MTEAAPRPLLVGELNPFGGPDSFALYPRPEHCSGGRLRRILGLTEPEYLDSFDRANLCRRSWSLTAARSRAAELLVDRGVLVLLGAKVCAAFGVKYAPFTHTRRGFAQSEHPLLVLLPHPSGLNRAWNEVGAEQRARTCVAAAVERRLRVCPFHVAGGSPIAACATTQHLGDRTSYTRVGDFARCS